MGLKILRCIIQGRGQPWQRKYCEEHITERSGEGLRVHVCDMVTTSQTSLSEVQADGPAGLR